MAALTISRRSDEVDSSSPKSIFRNAPRIWYALCTSPRRTPGADDDDDDDEEEEEKEEKEEVPPLPPNATILLIR